MHDAIEIQIQIVHLLTIWIWLGSIDGVLHAIYLIRLLFNDGLDDLGVLLGKPAKQRRNTHDAGSVPGSSGDRVSWCTGRMQNLDKEHG